MGWVKCLIISLGLLLVAQIALARDIEHFTDRQGTVHITNLEPRERGNRAKPDRPKAPLPPAALPAKSPDHPAVIEPAHPAPSPDLKPRMAPTPPPPALRGRPPKGPIEAGPASDRSDDKNEATVAVGAALPFQWVFWSPPPPQASAPPRGKITVYRDPDGLIHISNVPKEEAPPAAPLARMAVVEQPALPPEVLPPAWQRASWPAVAPAAAAGLKAKARAPSPVLAGKTIHRYRDRQGVLHITNLPPPDRLVVQAKLATPGDQPMVPVAHFPPAAPAPSILSVENQAPSPGRALPIYQEASYTPLGPEVATYIEGRLLAASQALAGLTIHRYRDPDGVWHITSNSPPEPPAGPTRLAATTEIVRPAAATGPPLTQMFPGLAGESGFGRPPPGVPDRTVIAQRDHRGVLHIISRAAVKVAGGRDSSMAFLRRIPPFVQFCVMEAAQLYALPVPLVLALIRQESNFAPLAVSPKGAMGLMQLMPGTAALLGVRDPFAPRENIMAGCRYFRFLLNCFQGSVPLALAAYNAGSQRVVSAGYRVPAIQETQKFVTRVMGLYCLLEKHAANL
jgi:hypothetical protein